MGALPVALEKTLSFIRNKAGACKPGTRLPGIRALAAECGVAQGTMCKGLRILSRTAEVSIIPGGGVFAGTVAPAITRTADSGPTGDPPTIPLRQPRWRQIRDDIGNAINEGRFVPGRMLPTGKELRIHYGTSHTVISTALHALVSTGRLRCEKRGYRIWQPAPQTGLATLDLLAETESIADLTHATPRSREFWRILEIECTRLNIRLRVQPASPALTPRDSLTTADSSRSAPLLGHIVWTLGLDEHRLMAILARLSQSGKPIAILDEEGVDASAIGLAANPLRRAFALGFDRIPGEVTGDFLIGLGHRRVASFQLVTQTPWCRNRTQGVVDAFVRAGYPAGSVTALSPQGLIHFEQLVRAMEQWPGIKRLSLDDALRIEAVSLSHNWDPGQLYTRHGDLRFWGRFLQDLFTPLFEQALTNRRITAWVAPNDVIGLLALAFLKKQRVRVPQQITVVGFDNSNEAFVSGLSSYHFNIPALVQAMLEHILPRDSRQRRKPCDRVQGIPGQVMHRASAGTALTLPR